MRSDGSRYRRRRQKQLLNSSACSKPQRDMQGPLTSTPNLRNASPTISVDLWRHLNPGSRILEAGFDEQDNLDGWWEPIIVRVDDDGFLVRWRDDPEPRVSRSHEYFAILHPKLRHHTA